MPNQDLAVTLVQSDIAWESVDQNLQRMERHLSAVNDSRLIVLPEMFTTGFSMRPEKIAETMDGKAVQWLRDTARAKRADLVGSVAIEEQGRYYNRLLWAKADGSLFSYDKKHLFSFAGEHEHYTAGDAPLIVKVDGWSVAAFVCYDLRFPVWSRNNNSQYDLALYIASWPERRAKHWQTLLPARAIENQAFVIGVNRVGMDGNDIRYSGDSMLIDPLGDTLYHGRQLESVYQARLSRAQLDDVRAQFPFLKDADRYQLV